MMEKIRPENGSMSSFNPGCNYQKAFDSSLSTMAHSNDRESTGNQFMDLTFDKSYNFASVTMTVWRWDYWCKNNLQSCARTYQRLAGMRIQVYKTGSEDFIVCGTVPNYDAPNLQTGVVPDPIIKTVHCGPTAVGNKMRLYQTRTNERLMISEIEILGRGKDSHFHLNHRKYLNQQLYCFDSKPNQPILKCFTDS
jgi:hypothetical protein